MPKIDLPTTLDRGLVTNVLDAIVKAIPNKFNDPIKRAAFDHALSTVLFNYAESRKDKARDDILTAVGPLSTGSTTVALAEKGVSCIITVAKGANRLDKKAVPGAIMKLGWKNGAGKLLTLKEISGMIDDASSTSAPSKTIKSVVSAAGDPA